MVSAVSEIDQLTRAATLALADTPASAHAALDSIPWIGSAIDDDSAARRFDTWGRSTAIDENTGTAVIPRALFDVLHDRAGIEATWPVGNAGLLHCYGYLLSLEATPYGLKRDRWVHGELARACGLHPDALLPWAGDSTLLARATSAASAILRAPASDAVQTIEGRDTRVALSSTSGPAALVYLAAPLPASAPLLITLFPVADPSAPLDEFRAAPNLRWNAV